MKAFSPMSRGERAAVACISSTVSLSLVAGLLLMFNDGQMPGFGSRDRPALADVVCANPGPAVATNGGKSAVQPSNPVTTSQADPSFGRADEARRVTAE